MQLSDITNLERGSLTKSITKKKQRLDPMQITNLKFEWIILDDDEKDLLSSKTSEQFENYEQTLWYQNQCLHFEYPITLENQNLFSENSLTYNIDEVKRHNLITWIGYVMSSFNTSTNETYFLALALVDKFLSLYDQKLTNQELLFVGISCLSLASKQKDLYFVSHRSLQLLTKNKFTEKDLFKCQFLILDTLNYQIEQPTYFMHFDYIMRQLEFGYYKIPGKNIETDPLNLRKMQIVYKCSLTLLKFVTQYYDSTMHKQSAIAFGCIYYTIKRMEQLQYEIPNVSDILVQIQNELGFGSIEMVLKLICKLCQNGMSQKQREFLFQTTFKY